MGRKLRKLDEKIAAAGYTGQFFAKLGRDRLSDPRNTEGQNPREVWYRRSEDEQPSSAPIDPRVPISWENIPGYNGKEVELGFPPNSSVLHVINITSKGVADFGNKLPSEQADDAAAHSPVANLPDLRVEPTRPPSKEVFVNTARYTKPSTGDPKVFYSKTTASAADKLVTAINALTGVQHQIVWICLDYETNSLVTVTGTAKDAVGVLPARKEFNDAEILGIATDPDYKRLLPVYLYSGQASIEEADHLRQYDFRLDFPLPTASSGGGSNYQTIQDDGSDMTQRGNLNFIAGTNVTLTITDNSDNDSTDVEIASSGGGGGSITADVYANRPAAGSAGALYLPTDGFAAQEDDGANWLQFGPLFPLTEPDNSAFAWINQGTASISAAKGGIYLSDSALGFTDSHAIRKKSAPSAPYIITAMLLPNWIPQDNLGYGLLFRESSSGKLHLFKYQNSGGLNISIQKWTNPTSFSAAYANISCPNQPVFMRIEDNNTNRICSISADGQNFMTVHSVGRTDFLTADEVGFFVNADSDDVGIGVTLVSWLES